MKEDPLAFSQSQKLESIGRLAGGVAHDFNNLLTLILSHSDLLLPLVEPRLREEVEGIRSAASRAAMLTRQLLAFSCQQPLEPRLLDPNEAVRDLEKMLRRLIGEDVELETRLATAPTVLFDPGQLGQVLLNLVLNAREAMPGGGRIVVESGRVTLEAPGQDPPPGDYALLQVSDTGQGMDEKTLSRIFEPFFTTKEGGSGLGLATVYGIVRQSGGAIRAYSQPGRGTTFKIYLPVAGQATAVGRPPLERPPAARGSETILVVEDEDPVRNLVCRLLLAHGYRVLEARDGCQALQICERRGDPVDLLVSDVVMPQMGGLELAEALTARYPQVKVLLLSGYSEALVHPEGGVAFLQKPFSADKLARAVRAALDGLGC